MKFNILDPHPGERLSDIMPLSVRAHSWLARVNVRIPEDKSTQIIGATTMLDGLDYHYSRYMDLVKRLDHYFSLRKMPLEESTLLEQLSPTAAETENLKGLDHEAVAYLNRLGQFYTFAKAYGLESHLLKTRELMVFRNKHTAHRSIDAPRGESHYDQDYQAMAFGFYRVINGGFPEYQMPSGKKHYTLDMRRDHPTVMQEAIDVLFALYPLSNDA